MGASRVPGLPEHSDRQRPGPQKRHADGQKVPGNVHHPLSNVQCPVLARVESTRCGFVWIALILVMPLLGVHFILQEGFTSFLSERYVLYTI